MARKLASKTKSQTVQLKKGLTRAQALSAAHKKTTSDYRAFVYDHKTGKATLT